MKSEIKNHKAPLAAVVTLACMMLISLRPGWAGELLDGIEAVVNGEVITMSELDRAVMVEAERLGMSPEDIGRETRRKILDAVIDRELLLAEARKFNIVDVSDKEVDAAFEGIEKRFGSTGELVRALDEHEMTIDELRDNIRDQITAVKYVDRRIRFFVRVTLNEQEEYYEKNRDEFGGRPFEEVSGDIRALLVERRTNEKLDEYMDSLREKADIRYPTDVKGKSLID